MDLGVQPLANALQDSPAVAEEYPLNLVHCPYCTHLQLNQTVDPGVLFSEYLYTSGTTATLRSHFQWIYDTVCEQTPSGRVLDIGCNDGSQLAVFQSNGWDVIGVDPATNLTQICINKGIPVINDFWGLAAAAQVGSVDCVLAQNVFAHTTEVDEFLNACKQVLNPGGSVYIQTSQADMVKNREFDTIYHEHVSYFNVKSMLCLAHRLGWTVERVLKPAIHGTSFLFELKYHQEDVYLRHSVYEMYMQDLASELFTWQSMIAYADSVRSTIFDLEKQLSSFRDQGYQIVGYGATAKSMTVLHSMSQSYVDFFIDENPLKINKFTPKFHTPVVGTDCVLAEKTVILMTAWNFAEEIKNKLRLRTDVGPQTQLLYYAPSLRVENLI